jgi:hypothetical protein
MGVLYLDCNRGKSGSGNLDIGESGHRKGKTLPLINDYGTDRKKILRSISAILAILAFLAIALVLFQEFLFFLDAGFFHLRE